MQRNGNTNPDKTPQPMDPGAVEGEVDEQPNTERKCYALETLVDEVLALFPETAVDYGTPSPRNVIFDATFTFDGTEPMAPTLVGCVLVDERVVEVAVEDQQVMVDIVRNPVTQDTRDTFALAQAWEAMQ